jgi:exosortase A-associated hydrolase 1
VTAAETPIRFACADSMLLGILHPTERPARRGVLIVVGGPQYRIGSHRQFVLLARALAQAGIPAMRFDYRGMGDSDGPFRGFEHIDADIAAAVAAFRAHCPALEEIVLWGLCDAASAILFYAHRDPAIDGIVLLNPWVRTDAGEAKTYIKHYYRGRLADREFWRKTLAGKLEIGASMRSFLSLARRALPKTGGSADPTQVSLPERMALGLDRYDGRVLLIMCGNDLTAREFDEAAKASPGWQRLLAAPRVTRHDLAEADHTFSSLAWRTEVAAWTIEWLKRVPAPQ